MNYTPDKATVLRNMEYATDDLHDAVEHLLDAGYDNKATIENIRKIESDIIDDIKIERMTNAA